LVWPATLSSDYSYNQIPALSLFTGLAALALVCAVFAAAVLSFRRSRVVFFFAMLFFLALFPASNLLIEIGSTMAERFLYLPSAGFAACVAICVGALARRLSTERTGGRAAVAVLSLVAVALAVRTYRRNFDWHDSLALWTAAVKASPNSFRAHMIYGDSLIRAQNFNLIPDAIQEEQAAVALLSSLPLDRSLAIPYATLGQLWLFYGDTIAGRDPAGAAEAYRSALRAFRSGIPIDRAHNQVAYQADIARGWLPRKVADIGNALLYSGLSTAFERLGRLPEAIEAQSTAVRLTPADADAYSAVSELQEKNGSSDEALRSAAEALLLGRSEAQFDQFEKFIEHTHPDGCEVGQREYPAMLNLSCPAVRAAACDADRRLIQAFWDTHHPELVAPYRAASMTGAACETR
jgi:tetratricopeptide (TPR) repeat protein